MRNKSRETGIVCITQGAFLSLPSANNNIAVQHKVTQLGLIALQLINLQEQCKQLEATEVAELLKIVELSLCEEITASLSYL